MSTAPVNPRKDKLNCFYVPGAGSIIDVAVQDAHGWVSQIHRRTLSQLQEGNPGVVMGDLDEWIQRHEQSRISDPVEITAEQWDEALGVLPPEGWHGIGTDCQSFKMMEYLSGRVTSVYVMLFDRYFTFHDVASLPHADCLAKVRKAFPTP